MYNGGFFGGQPSGPLGIGVPSGWGNISDTDEEMEKERAKPPEENQSDETRRMRNRFLSWFPRAKRSAFVFGSKGVSWGGKRIFPDGNRSSPALIKDLGLDGPFPPQLFGKKIFITQCHKVRAALLPTFVSTLVKTTAL